MKRHLTILFLLLVSIGFAQNEKRLALVVGNSEYLGKGNSLANPAHDAEDVSAKLKTLGFDVTTLIDGSLLQMDDAIDAFGRKAKNYDVAMFYYSGHGIQSKGENYLVPVDAELRSEADVRYKCNAVNHLIAKLEESGCPMKIIVLDACRNNPFERSWHRSAGGTGLSFISAPKGTLISYATSPGMTADDGRGRNSPYTTAFLQTLNEPNLSLLNFFNEVGTKVQNTTNEEQIPWVTSSALKGSFYFNMNEEDTPAAPIEFERMAKELEELRNKAQSSYNKAKQYLDNEEIEKAIPFLLEAANSGHTEAQSKLGFFYFKGYGVDQDYEMAIKWYKKASASGDDVAQRNLGFMYEHGFGIDKPDIEGALGWYWKSAMNGNKSASEDYARLLHQYK